MVQIREYSLINGRSILYIFHLRKITSFHKNLEKPIIVPLNGYALGVLQCVELKLAKWSFLQQVVLR